MKYTKQNPLRVFTSFSGYDSQCLSLERLKRDFPDFDYTLVGWSEIDKAAIVAHDALFPDAADKNFGDITQIDEKTLPDFDLFTMSSPCQDFSSAGKQAGGEEGSGTRSSLLWECGRIIEAKRPKYVLLENVSALISKKFVEGFNKWQRRLESYGYVNFLAPAFPTPWKENRRFTKAGIINAADMGVPQNRERVFLLSIRDDGDNPTYSFPKPFPLQRVLKDLLEPKVDEKYYLSDKMLEYFQRVNEDDSHGHKFKPTGGGIATTVKANPACNADDNFVKDENNTTVPSMEEPD